MRNRFQLTEKSNEILLRILKTGLMVAVVLLFVVFLKNTTNISFSSDWIRNILLHPCARPQKLQSRRCDNF